MSSERYSVAVNPHPGKGELVVLFGGRERTKPSHNVGPQVRDYFLVHHVLSGKGTFQCLGRTYELGAGESFFIFPGELIRYTADADDPWTYRWVGFRGDRAEELLNGMGISRHRPVARPARHKRAAALFHQIERTFRFGEPNGDMKSGGLLRLLLAEYVKEPMGASNAEQGRTDRAAELVERTIRWLTVQHAQPVSIEKMAQSLGYNRTHLSKLFRQHTGMSPMRFLLNIRMERAKLLLLENLTVEQVAASVGFADPLYFSRQFKKWCGRTPTEYRQSAQAGAKYDCSGWEFTK